MRPIAREELLDRYEVFLLDAYGVLVDASGALPGASEFLRELRRRGKRVVLLSNDASRTLDTSLARYRGLGLDLRRDEILTSGLLLRDHFAREGLIGARCIVLGTEDSNAYVRDAGGVVVGFGDASASAVVVADDEGYPFLHAINQVVTVLLARLERGERTALVLPNPDLVFPAGDGGFGIASGAVAALIEAVLRLRDPSGSLRFVPLGKPHAPMYEAAFARHPDVDRSRMVMIGDQLGTDVLGAHRAGIDSVLVMSGVARPGDLAASAVQPTFTLQSVG